MIKAKQKAACVEFIKSIDLLLLQKRLGHKHPRSTIDYAVRNGLFQMRWVE